jgi:magnesium-transporting ATPase (P-type)
MNSSYNSSNSFFNYSKIADLIVIGIVFLILIGFLAFDYEYFSFKEQIVKIPYHIKIYFDLLPWILFIVLAFDLYFKFRIAKNWNKFIRINWIDIIMILLIPFLFPMKFFKIFIKPYKMIKAGKYTIKSYQKIYKVMKTWRKKV